MTTTQQALFTLWRRWAGARSVTYKHIGSDRCAPSRLARKQKSPIGEMVE